LAWSQSWSSNSEHSCIRRAHTVGKPIIHHKSAGLGIFTKDASWKTGTRSDCTEIRFLLLDEVLHRPSRYNGNTQFQKSDIISRFQVKYCTEPLADRSVRCLQNDSSQDSQYQISYTSQLLLSALDVSLRNLIDGHSVVRLRKLHRHVKRFT